MFVYFNFMGAQGDTLTYRVHTITVLRICVLYVCCMCAVFALLQRAVVLHTLGQEKDAQAVYER